MLMCDRCGTEGYDNESVQVCKFALHPTFGVDLKMNLFEEVALCTICRANARADLQSLVDKFRQELMHRKATVK